MILRLRLIFYTDDERGDRMPAYVNGNGHKGSNCVIRGGSWNNNARNCRVS
ncbi:MAG: hypothetical protein OSJ36_08580 [Odoribacter sp.]|nr:hypothetical protein [Odoribacter sp.]